MLTHLRHLRVCSERQVRVVLVMSICWLTRKYHQLDTLTGYWLSDLDRCIPIMKDAIASNSRTIRRLCLYDSLFPECPKFVLGNLRELDIWSPRMIDEHLVELFRHAPQLECLSLADVNFNDIFPVLDRYPTALPRLTDLKVMSIEPPECDDALLALVHFVENKPNMRMLDVRTSQFPS